MSDCEQIADGFAANLFMLRRRAGLTQEEVAKRTGLHRTEIGLLETHRTEIGLLETRKRVPRIDTFVKLCDSLEVRPKQLFEGVEWVWGQQRFVSSAPLASELISSSSKSSGE